MTKKLKVYAVLLLTIGLLLSGCGQKTSSPSAPAANGSGAGNNQQSSGKEPVKIGLVLPLTALYGKQVEQGAQVAQKIINDQGGILGGRQIEILKEDDQAKPEVGVSAFKKLMEREKVDAIAGAVNSSVGIAEKNVTKDKILHVVSVAKAPEITNEGHKWLFRLNSTNDMDGKLFHTFIAEKIKPKNVAVLAENTDYGQAEVKALQTNWQGPDAPQIVATEYFELNATDYTNPLTKLKSANADALYVVGATIEENASIFKQAHELGFNDVIKLLAPGNLNTKVIELAGQAAEGVISADLYVNTIDNPTNKMFVEAFEKQFGHKPEKIEMLGFETVWLIAKAMEQAGSSTDYDKIAEILLSKEWDTPRGKVKFDEHGQALGEVSPLIIKEAQIQAYNP